MGMTKNLMIELGEFDETDEQYWDSFSCQIQAEEFQYRQSIRPQPKSDDDLVPF